MSGIEWGNNNYITEATGDLCEMFILPEGDPSRVVLEEQLQCTIQATKMDVTDLLSKIDAIPEDNDFCIRVSENLTIKSYNSLARQVNDFFDTCKTA
jgi:hypothetical protein